MHTAEQDSILSQVSFTEFLDQVQDGLYIVDPGLTIVFWNKAAEELTGLPASVMVGKSCVESSLLDHRTLLGESLCTRDTCPLLRCIETDSAGTIPQVILMNTASGRPLPISLSVGPLRGRDGKGIGAIALFRGMREEFQQRKLAVEIQKHIVTARGFTRNGVRVDSLYAPVDELGGDFMEAFFLDDHTLVATMADATGHGISAALFTVVYKSLLHASFAQCRQPGQVLEQVNRGFLETAGIDGFYIGACLAIYDTVTRRGRYTAAGHPRSLLFAARESGFALQEQLGMQSLMLGMNEKARYGELGFQIEPGGFLFLSSDGMMESPCTDGTQFGIKGIETFFSRYAGSTPLDDLIAEVRHRSAFLPLTDDASALLVTPESEKRAPGTPTKPI
jgi:sigma-B regulation protein RsbU (phosphoserine phosphatase)